MAADSIQDLIDMDPYASDTCRARVPLAPKVPDLVAIEPGLRCNTRDP